MVNRVENKATAREASKRCSLSLEQTGGSTFRRTRIYKCLLRYLLIFRGTCLRLASVASSALWTSVGVISSVQFSSVHAS